MSWMPYGISLPCHVPSNGMEGISSVPLRNSLLVLLPGKQLLSHCCPLGVQVVFMNDRILKTTSIVVSRFLSLSSSS